jgi:hypothetical protein
MQAMPDHLLHDDMPSSSIPRTEQGIAMFLLLEDYHFPSITPTLEIREMRDNLGLWSIPLIQGFKLVPKVIEVYTIRPQPVSDIKEKIFHYSGLLNNRPVCSLSLSIAGNRARIDDLATIPTLQRKGYATQLIYAALKQAQQLQARYCFLDASASGLNLYKKIGFTRCYIQRYYAKALDPSLIS